MKVTAKMTDEQPIVMMAPMIDIIFILLIFFLTTSLFARMENELSITVPTADESQPPQRTPGEIIINLTVEGVIVVNQRQLTLQELQDILMKIGKLYKDQSVIIRGDRDALFGKAISILDACARAGIWNVSFAAMQSEPGEVPG